MKNIIYILMIILLSSCLRQNNAEHQMNNSSEEVNTFDVSFQELNIAMYINSMVGLVVRESPDPNGIIIAFLDYSTEVFALKKDEREVIIDGVKSNWVYIINGNIQGWVYDIYLSSIKPNYEQQEDLALIIDEYKIIPEPMTEYTLRDIIRFISRDYHYFRPRNANSLREYLGLNNITEEYIIMNRRTIDGFHSISSLELYEIEVGVLKLSVVENEYEKRYLTLTVEIELNENNYLHLFPYMNIEEYKIIDNFGEIHRQGIDYLEYTIDEDRWGLIFYYGKLVSIEYKSFIP